MRGASGFIEAMELPGWDTFNSWYADALIWLRGEVLVWAAFAQLGAVLAALGAAWFAARPLKAGLALVAEMTAIHPIVRRAARVFQPLSLPLVWLILQWVSVAVASGAGWPHRLIAITVSLLTAWVVIRLATGLLASAAVARMVALIAWSIAALSILGLLTPLMAALDAASFNLGSLRLSALIVLKGILTLALLLWLAAAAGRALEARVRAVDSLTPSVQVLITKLVKILLVTTAIVAGLSAVGIDLTAFAVFSGAVGVGIGFGLQKVVSNFVSGIILLLDRSIKPGDVIAIGETYGWINSLNARFASVITRDGVEHLIPNELLITERVENWSFTHRRVRVRLPIGVAYKTDLRQAIALCIEAAQAVERVIETPTPQCLLMGFGDNSVDLELRVWIRDPQNGVANVRSDVLLQVWDRFREHGIEIPFPQRDVHLSADAPVPVVMAAAKKTPARKRKS
ncbi:MAG: mechanosensitive ion channel family protein [Alphaproteobacteria bacterium]